MHQIRWLNFQDLLHNLSQDEELGLCLIDQDGKILSLNSVAAMILNVDKVIGHSFTELFPYEDAVTLLQGHRDFFERSLPHPLQDIPHDFNVSWLRANLENSQGLLLMLRENQVERISNDYWSKIALRSLDEAIVITDREGLVLYLNEGAEHLIKISKVQAVGQMIHQTMKLLDSESEMETTIPLEKVLLGAQFTSGGTHVLLDHQGKKVPISEFITSWKDTLGNIKGMVIAFRERRRTVETPMRGSIEAFEDAFTLLQHLSTVKREGALTLVHGVSEFVFYLRNSKLVHFDHKEFDQITALMQVAKLKQGSFTFDSSAKVKQETMNEDLMSLIIDIARQVDEVKRTRAEAIQKN